MNVTCIDGSSASIPKVIVTDSSKLSTIRVLLNNEIAVQHAFLNDGTAREPSKRDQLVAREAIRLSKSILAVVDK